MSGPSLLSVEDYRQFAEGRIERGGDRYLFSGAYREETIRDNAAAFSRHRFRPRMLRDVSTVDMTSTVLGQPISAPMGVSPMSLCCMAHPDGELGIARACERHNVPFVLSTVSSVSMEDIAAGAPNSVRWFQLYVYKERRMTEELVRRAERAGFSALVLTVDAPVVGRRLAVLKEGFSLPAHIRLANIEPREGTMSTVNEESKKKPYLKVVGEQLSSAITWDDVSWLMTFTKLPVIVKGIMTGEDASIAVSRGVAGVWVSNHGGRQLDGTLATIDVLEEVVQAVKGRCEVYLDSGVRSGYDVIKAIALGARAVFIGRPALWGLVYKGTEGVDSLLQLVKDEMSNALALLGVNRLQDLNHDYVVHESQVSKI